MLAQRQRREQTDGTLGYCALGKVQSQAAAKRNPQKETKERGHGESSQRGNSKSGPPSVVKHAKDGAKDACSKKDSSTFPPLGLKGEVAV